MRYFHKNHQMSRVVAVGLVIGLTGVFALVSHPGAAAYSGHASRHSVTHNSRHASRHNTANTGHVCVISPTFSGCYDSVDQIPASEWPSNLPRPTAGATVVGTTGTGQ